MFRRKEKNKRPCGVQFSIELNAMALEDVANNSEPPSIQGMTDAWLNYNCTKICVGIAAINTIDNRIIYMSGPNGSVCMTMDFDINLPFPVGSNKTEIVEVRETKNFIFLSFEGVVIMAVPAPYILNLLNGEPIIEYHNTKKDRLGDKSDIVIEVSSPNGEYSLPILSNVAKEWFKYENTVAKVLTTLILEDNDFPLELGISTS